MEGKFEEEINENYFHRLPDDILLSIFTTMQDFKFVCQCSLVCKRFAYLIPHMRNITITFTSSDCESESQQLCQHVFCKKLCPYSSVTPKMGLTCLRQTLKFINWLRKFEELTSVHINFSYGMETSSSSLLQWKAKFGPELEYVVALLPSSIEKKPTQEDSQEQGVRDIRWILANTSLEQFLNLSYGCCQETVVRQTILYMLIEQHPKLSSVIITDSDKQGRLCMQEEQLLELKSKFENKTLEQVLDEVKIPYIWKVGYVPLLRLPASGYILKAVTLFIFKPKGDASTSGEHVDVDSDLLAWHCDGDEMFRDSLKEMLVTHKQRMYAGGIGAW